MPMNRPRIRILALTLGLTALVSGGPAVGATSGDNFWATLNICDTLKHPNGLGVRGRMPGDGTNKQMWMRFFAQYRKDGVWRPLASGGVSPWVRLGTADVRWRATGWTFIVQIKPGQRFKMRGLVKYQWRRNGNVLRSAQKYTTAGHNAGEADPPGYSEATCFVTG